MQLDLKLVRTVGLSEGPSLTLMNTILYSDSILCELVLRLNSETEKQNKTKQNKKWCYIPTPSLSIMYLSDSVYYYRDTCTFMFFAAPLTAAEKWNPPRFVRKDK